MTRSSTAFASLAILAALAAAPLAARAEAGNVVGGGGVLAQSGRLARFAGSHGDGLLVEYLAPAPAGAGREAQLVGGGDNAEVVYN